MLTRRRFVVSTAAALTACSGGANPNFSVVQPDDDLNFGAVIDPAEFAAVTQALPPEALAVTTLPTARARALARVVLSNLPTVSAQGVGGSYGSPGTCEAQSFGYGLGSYTAAQTAPGVFKWYPNAPENLVSAAWLFAWAMAQKTSTCPKGGRCMPYLQLLVESGAPSVSDVPYNPNGYTTAAQMCAFFSSIPTSSDTYPDATRFGLGSYNSLPAISAQNRSTLLPLIKSFLAAGYAIAFTGLVAPGYSQTSPTLVNDVFYLNGTASGGHGQLLVGYDDTLGASSDPGAFLVQNSFGSGWNPGPANDPGRNGRVWYSYTSWFATQKFAATALPIESDSRDGVALTASVADAPLAVILSAHDWYDADAGKHVLVLRHRFGSPLRLKHLSVSDAFGQTFDEDHGGSSKAGYTYVRRANGEAFAQGTYRITLSARTRADEEVHYRGTLGVPLS